MDTRTSTQTRAPQTAWQRERMQPGFAPRQSSRRFRLFVWTLITIALISVWVGFVEWAFRP